MNKTPNEMLLPCPFCGGRLVEEYNEKWSEPLHIMKHEETVNNCPLSDYCEVNTRYERKKWNTRPTPTHDASDERQMKPCPNCHQPLGFLASCFEWGEVKYYVRCNGCEHDGRKAETENAALSLWNCSCTRATASQPVAAEERGFDQWFKNSILPTYDHSIPPKYTKEALEWAYHAAQAPLIELLREAAEALDSMRVLRDDYMIEGLCDEILTKLKPYVEGGE